MELSRLVSRLKPSPTLALNQKAKSLAAAGKSIVNLSAGEPDVPTPDRICAAAIEAIHRRETRYTASSGIPELKDAVLRRIGKVYGRTYDRSEVIVTCGAKQAISNLSLSILNPGDEAIIFAPYWTSYVDMVQMAGAIPVVIQTFESAGFSPTLEQVRAQITSKTKLIFLNSPCNPTGAVYSEKFLSDLAIEVQKHPNILVMTDDIYEPFVYDGKPFFSIGMVSSMPKEKLVIVNGVSKTYAMTGWRIGFAVGPKSVISAMDTISSNTTSGAASISQWAAVEAVNGYQADVGEMRKLFQNRREEIYKALIQISGITCYRPEGAFYIFPNVEKFIGKKTSSRITLSNDVVFSEHLLDAYGLAVVPGSVFGAEGYLRLSFAASSSELEEGVARLKKALAALRD